MAQSVKKNVVIDSILLETVADSDLKDAKVAQEEASFFKNRTITFEKIDGIHFPDEIFEDYKGFQYLISFYEKLYQLESAKKGDIRIAYYGDSMTDGDMIVKDFRNALQNKFGGQGVGFVSVTSESASSRATLTHQFSTNWKTLSYLNIKKPSNPFGINGHVFFANDTTTTTWVKFKANNFPHCQLLNQPTLFYGKSFQNNGYVSIITGKDTLLKKLNGKEVLNSISLSNSDIKSVKVDFNQAKGIPIYGFNFDNGEGVHVDNFSNRGNSGLPISIFNTQLMQAFHKRFDYDLIILHYGTNVLNYGSYNYDWYERKMKQVVAHLKNCFPGAAILVVSTADKATKYDLVMKTDSAVIPLNMAQRKYALKSQAGFFDLFSKMGGAQSMVKWTEEEPVLAAKDYTHFNHKGAKKVADMLYKQLIEGYEEYKKLRALNPKVTPKKKSDSLSKNIDSIYVP